VGVRRSATIGVAPDNHLLVVDGVTAGALLSTYGSDWAQHPAGLGALDIHAVCLDRNQPSKPLAHVTLSKYRDGLAPCGTRPLVTPRGDGTWFVRYTLCGTYPVHGALTSPQLAAATGSAPPDPPGSPPGAPAGR